MFAKIIGHKITLVILSILVIGVLSVGGYLAFLPQTEQFSTVLATLGNVQESVTSSGSIDSNEDVSLSFQNSGTVASLDVAVGDPVSAGQVLASLDNSSLEAQLEGANADVEAAQANLNSLQNGATSQTLAVYAQGVSTASTTLSTAVEDAYLKASDAILNKSDALFQNPTSANPTILIPTDSYATGLSLNNQRVMISTVSY